MNDKPTYKDYKKQRKYMLRKGAYIESGGREYTIGDKWLFYVFFAAYYILMSFILNCNPYYDKHLYFWLYFAGSLILIPSLVWACQRFFIYRFSWFHVHKERQNNVPDYLLEYMPDEYEDEKTDARRREKRKSRLCFAALLVAIILFGFLFYSLTFGLAHQRLYDNHKQELEQLVQITQKYDNIYVNNFRPDPLNIVGSLNENESSTPLPEADADAIRAICASLNGHYVYYIFGSQDNLIIWLNGGIFNRNLEWYPDNMTYDEVLSSSYDKKAVQLDDHWWCDW